MQFTVGVHVLAIAATLTYMPFAHVGPPLLDFSNAEIVQAFRVINDDVMGGVTTSRLSSVGGSMLFEGEVSIENNGGFASFRGPVTIPADAAALLLTVRGDGQRYKLTLRLDDGPRTAQYQAAFVAPQEWQTLRFEATDFTASYRGRPVDAPKLHFADMRYVGLLIADRQQGAFKVELKAVHAR